MANFSVSVERCQIKMFDIIGRIYGLINLPYSLFKLHLLPLI